MTPEWSWDEMTGEFRALGGAADNVCMGAGTHGRGLFPIDTTKPVNLFVPENLLLRVADIAYVNGTVRLKPEAKVGARERQFFERYQESYGWGGGGREECAAFIDAMDALPSEIRAMLAKDFGMAVFFRGERDNRIEHRFLKSRMLGSKGRYVLMPVIELVNHGRKGVSFQYKEGIVVSGTFEEEILVHYFDATDPFTDFTTWGFAHDEPLAFSLFMNIPSGNRRLVIQRQIQEKAKLGDARGPVVKTNGNQITLSHLLIGSSRFPRVPKGVFYRIMQDLGESNAEELFDRIVHFNRMKFLQLLAALERHEGQMINTLKQTAIYQLQSMSHAIGARQV
ncbi:MAG: hypothetical protein ACT4OG_02625 [Alphaproteobacteria bacterium]